MIESSSQLFTKYVSRSVLAMIGLSLYLLADTYFIAAGMGSDGITALNLAIPVYSLINALGLLLGMGAASQYAIYCGQGQKEQADSVFSHAFIMALALGLGLMGFGFFGTSWLATLLGADSQILPLVIPYMRTEFLFAPAMLLHQVYICFVRNDMRPGLAMAGMVSGCMANIVLDYIFIFIFNWGMFGAAFATCLAPIISICVLSSHFWQKKHNFHFNFKPLSFKVCGRFLPLGITAFINEYSSGLVIMLFNFIILDISGNLAVAAYGIIANLALIMISIFVGIAQGIQPLISYNLGMGQMAAIFKFIRYGLICGLIVGVISYIVVLLFNSQLTDFFNTEDDPALQVLAEWGMIIYFSSFLFTGINIVASAALAALARPKAAFIISISRGMIIVSILVLILPRFWQINGVWLAMPVAELLTAVISMVFLIRIRKLNKF